MIPENITRVHILEAIDAIDKAGVPKSREATKYGLNHNNKLYRCSKCKSTNLKEQTVFITNADGVTCFYCKCTVSRPFVIKDAMIA